MTFWTFVFLCVIAGIAHDIWKKHHKAKHADMIEHEGKPGARERARAQVCEMEAQISELRERVEVLERIITDEAGPLRLAQDIERLRDKE